jgi:Carboxypeptidase regulatory-like domain
MRIVSSKSGIAVTLFAAMALGACSSGSGGGPTDSGPTTVTVSGTVVDEQGILAPNETVIISSGTFSKSVVSDANGAFSVANVMPPYNATVLDSGGKTAIEYQGLTRPDPTLTTLIFLTTNRSATIAGQFSGGNYPETAGYSTEFIFSSPQVPNSVEEVDYLAAGTYSPNPISWVGPTTTTGTLYALQIHSASGLPIDYPGYGTLSGVLLQDTGSVASQNVALAGVATGTLSGSVTLPAGYTVQSKSVALQVAPGVLLSVIGSDNSTSTSFTYTMPSIANTSLTILISSESALSEVSVVKKTSLAASTSGVALTSPAAPSLSLPVDTATGVTVTTPFTWTQSAGVTVFVSSTSGSGPSFAVITAATTTTLPDLSTAGLPLPASTAYSWQLITAGPATSIDGLAAAGGLLKALTSTDGYYTGTVERTFTTAP